ncbi:MAG: low temperature requirement protein A [Candidatus Nanopelagicales bacterium]
MSVPPPLVWRRPMAARDTTEQHRASTPLELFFDLCFVVAVAAAAAQLHHAEGEAHVSSGLPSYLMVFFAIWWAWMNVTWFASAYDSQDVTYRVAVLAMIAGALVLAAGVPRAFTESDFTVVTLGYVVMRIPLVLLWLRASRHDPERRATDRRMALGVTLCQVGWVLLLLAPGAVKSVGFLLLVVAELSVPFLAERGTPTPWHPEHIAERYGLFTLIVLGESVLAGSVAIGEALDLDQLADVWPVAVGGLLLVFSMWWKYFARPADDLLTSSATAFRWGYGHYLVFASAAAVGAGIAVNVDAATGLGELDARAAAATVTVPAAIYIATVWWLHLRPHEDEPSRGYLVAVGVPALLLSTFAPEPVLVAGLVAAALVAAAVVLDVRAQSSPR